MGMYDDPCTGDEPGKWWAPDWKPEDNLNGFSSYNSVPQSIEDEVDQILSSPPFGKCSPQTTSSISDLLRIADEDVEDEENFIPLGDLRKWYQKNIDELKDRKSTRLN